LVALLFTDIYFGNVTSESESASVGTNISFVSGIILALLFKVDIVKGLYDIITESNQDKSDEIYKADQKESWKNKY
jgi:hypothetical protein